MNRQEIRQVIEDLEKQQPRNIDDFEFRESEIIRLLEML